MILRLSVLTKLILIVALAANLLSCASAHGQTIIQVPLNFPAIQSAINAANNGDTVLVGPGTYVENINFNGKVIIVTSSDGPSTTIIDGNHNGTVVSFNHSETAAAVLSGFTIRNGFKNGGFGGGILIQAASPTIKNNIITGNHAASGIGIYVYDGSPTIKNNTITNNDNTGAGSSGFNGSGITIDGIDPSASPQVVSNAITNNSSEGGIGIYSNGTPFIQGNLIQGNTSGDGGGLSFQGYGSPIISQNLIVGNAASDNGAGIWISLFNASYLSPVLVLNNTIAGNNGGPPHETSGIYTTGFAQNANFVNNVVVAVAGQNAVTCDATYSSVSPVFSHNDAYSFGGAGFTGWCVANFSSGNLFSDPQLLAAANNDFHLAKSSPAVDAGDSTAAYLPSTDYDGNPRIADGNGDGTAVVDMGVYEVVNTSAAALNPVSLIFNPQTVGTTSSAQSVSLISSGATPFQITSILTTSGFTETSNCSVLSLSGGGAGIAAGNSCSINVVFSTMYPFPGITGTLTVNGTNGESLTTSLSGTGTNGPVASLSTANLVFSPQIVGSMSAPQLVTIANPGTGTVNISSIIVNGPFSQTSNCGNALTAGSSCTISVVFAPVAFGPAISTLAIQDQVSGLNYSVTLSGTGIDFSVAVSSSSIALLAGSAVQIPVTVNALGGAYSSSVSLSCSGVPANTACSFSPVTAQAGFNSFASTMTISSQSLASGGTYTVTISGVSSFGRTQSTQLQLMITKPNLALSASTLPFAPQPVGGTSAASTLTITNNGAGPFNLSSIAASSSFTQTNNCPSVLAVNSSCSVNVAFQPAAYGQASGALSIQDNIDGLSYSVALAGVGVDFAVSTSPATATVVRGNSAGFTVSVNPLGGPYNSPVALSCSGLPSGSACAFSPQTAQPGSSGSTVNLTITTDQKIIVPGTYVVTVVGNSSPTHSSQIQVTVTKNKNN
jgi:parallel beta-helix repeat protein